MFRSLVVLAGLLVGLPFAFAEEPPAAGQPPPPLDPKQLVLTADSKLPKGWQLKPDADAKGAVDRLTEAVRLALKPTVADPSQVTVVGRELAGPKQASATVAVVMAPRVGSSPPTEVRKALEAPAKTAGWAMRDVGTPALVLLVAGPAPARNELLVAATQWAAERLALLGEKLAETHLPAALAMFDVAIALEPKCVRAQLLIGSYQWALAYSKRPEGSFERAVKHLELALVDKAPYPFTPVERAADQATLGSDYLFVPGQEEKAYAALTAAIADPAYRKHESYWNSRFNLACAAARAKKLDPAFAELEATLAQDAKEGVPNIEHWREEPDFTNLRADPRWKALLEKYPADK